MGLLQNFYAWRHAKRAQGQSNHPAGGLRGGRLCRFEQIEKRWLLSAAPIQIGAVYFEDSIGADDSGDVFEVAWEGGAAGTQLAELTIQTDKAGDGLTAIDTFFDTAPGGLGVSGAGAVKVLESTGFTISSITVSDGGTELTFTFSGFDPGEKLRFSVDVDEKGFLSDNPVAEGAEFEGSQLVGTFTAPHYYERTGSDIFWDAYDPKLSSSTLKDNLPPDNYGATGSESRVDQTAGAVFSMEQTPLPISIVGTVYEDTDLDNFQDGGERGIGNVSLSLLVLIDGQFSATGKTAVTDASGSYRFEGLLPGTYRVAETQPGGYYSVGATAGNVGGSPRGTVLDADTITGIELLGGEDSIENDFAEAAPAQLSGHVYHDADNDGVFDAGETGIGGATVSAIRLVDGSAVETITVTTAADGSWSATNLRPGAWQVTEVTPSGYLDGLDAAGTAGGTANNPGDSITGIQLLSGQAGRNYDFGELVPASIAGRVIADLDGNCIFTPGDLPLEGVTVRLRDAQGELIGTATTDADGRYRFEGLSPGVYLVEELQPQGYFDGGDHVGSAGGSKLAPDSIIDITIVSGTIATGYDFCEIPPSSIRGRVSADLDGDGAYDPGEPLLEGVTVYLLDSQGHRLTSTETGADGRYEFTNLAPGTYGVEEVQPNGYFDGSDQVGSEGGSLLAPDSIVGVVLIGGTDAVNYDFSELIPSSIRGRVSVDSDGDGEYDPNETLLEGVTVELFDSEGVRVATTTTDAAGRYEFTNLRPGSYTVTETQPADYFDGSDHAGSAGGSLRAPDSITGITLISGTEATGYDFFELEPVSLSGYVYVDLDNDGVRDSGEVGIAGVKLTLLDADGKATARTATTDASGFYRFDGLAPNVEYGVAEAQPESYYDGLDTAGTAGGTAENPGDSITGALLGFGVNGKNYNFGELPPASIRGVVHGELDGDCIVDPGEPLLEGVTIYLLDASGNRIASTKTNAAGEYEFTRLAPGTYGVEEIQPAGYLQGITHEGSEGGTVVEDTISDVSLGPGVNAIDYNFCEAVPASISGYVFQDGPVINMPTGTEFTDASDYRDGKKTSDDKPIAGVVLQLGDGSGAALLGEDGRPITTVTDERGYYEFKNLYPGTYTVIEVHPDNFVDGIDTPGTNGGLAVNPHQEIDPLILMQLAIDPADDAIIRIPLGLGEQATSYNFSEVRIKENDPYNPPTPPKRWDPLPPPTASIGGDPGSGAVFYHPGPTLWRGSTMYGGAGIVPRYTWHLSVVNAGKPRNASDPQDESDLPTTEAIFFDPLTWTGSSVDMGQWVFADSEGQETKQATFGIEGGTPLVGDFNGDGIDEIAIFRDGVWFLDLNGNGYWDEGDLWAKLGLTGDQAVVGDWDGDGKADIGIFGPSWSRDDVAIQHEPGLPDAANQTDVAMKNVPPEERFATAERRLMKQSSEGPVRSDVIDHVFQYGSPGDVAISGDWNGDGISNIGLFRQGTWYLDMDGDGRWNANDRFIESFGAEGDLPVVGDFNGDGIDELGIYRDGQWRLDTDGNYRLDKSDRVVHLGGAGDKPVAGDFNGDGVDELAVYHDRTDAAVTPPPGAVTPTPAPATAP
ncbi:MAG: SdrD B-like domain-containing protein [Thermoguttaceae bacterium]